MVPFPPFFFLFFFKLPIFIFHIGKVLGSAKKKSVGDTTAFDQDPPSLHPPQPRTQREKGESAGPNVPDADGRRSKSDLTNIKGNYEMANIDFFPSSLPFSHRTITFDFCLQYLLKTSGGAVAVPPWLDGRRWATVKWQEYFSLPVNAFRLDFSFF